MAKRKTSEPYSFETDLASFQAKPTAVKMIAHAMAREWCAEWPKAGPSDTFDMLRLAVAFQDRAVRHHRLNQTARKLAA